jgi:SAM-dependent methyltransferase
MVPEKYPMTLGSADTDRYSYAIDPSSQTTAAKLLRLVGYGKRVLELGTALGAMTKILREAQGCTVVGVECNPETAAIAATWCEKMVVGDVESLDLAETTGGDFDVILAADILEHLVDPWQCLEKLTPLLRPDGYLVISVPNVAHVGLLAALLQGRFPYRTKGLLDFTHLRFFTRADLEELLLACGFLPVKWDAYHLSPQETEFSWLWFALPESIRAWLITREDGDVYQFIVKAIPTTEAASGLKWRQVLEAKEQELASLKARLERVEADLAEHRKAFAEARELLQVREQTIAELTADLAEHRKAFAEARELLQVREQTIAELKIQLEAKENDQRTRRWWLK